MLLKRGLLTLIVMLGWSAPGWSLESVRVQLKWKHQFQFAGYYAAQELGYYAEAGLSVELLEADDEHEPVTEVLGGQAQYGVGGSGLLLNRAAGDPVVVLGVVFQHSPLVLLTQRDEIIDLQALQGHSVAIEAGAAELFAFLRREGVDPATLEITHHSFTTADLLAGRVAAMSAYLTDEPFLLAQANLPYRIFSPASAGIDFYGDNFFTSQTHLDQHPEQVEAFRQATLKGWRYAMEHPDEMVRRIWARSQRHSREHLMFEAERMLNLLRLDLVAPGYMHRGRWQAMADIYRAEGMLENDIDWDHFLYQAPIEQRWVWQEHRGLLVGLILGGIGLLGLWVANRRLAARRAHLRTVVDHVPSALVMIDRKGLIREWNRQAEQIFGWSSKEAVGKVALELLVPPDVRPKVARVLESTFDQSGLTELTNWNVTKDGRWILCQWRNVMPPIPGGADYLLSMALDVTESYELHRKLKQMAHSDPLTGIANRLLFDKQLDQALALAHRNRQWVALLFFDLDDFKSINDQWGHAVGDQVLCQVAQRLTLGVRDSDRVARLGGDEFVVLLHACQDVEAGLQVANKLLDHLREPMSVTLHPGEERTINLDACVGVSLYPLHGLDRDSLFSQADRAMYRRKQQGKSGVTVAEALDV